MSAAILFAMALGLVTCIVRSRAPDPLPPYRVIQEAPEEPEEPDTATAPAVVTFTEGGAR